MSALLHVEPGDTVLVRATVVEAMSDVFRVRIADARSSVQVYVPVGTITTIGAAQEADDMLGAVERRLGRTLG